MASPTVASLLDHSLRSTFLIRTLRVIQGMDEMEVFAVIDLFSAEGIDVEIVIRCPESTCELCAPNIPNAA